MQDDRNGRIQGELKLIAQTCERLKSIAISADRKFLAHLLDLTITECQGKPVLPISDLRAISAQMRRSQLELSVSASDHANTVRWAS